MSRTQFVPLFLALLKRYVAAGSLILVDRRASRDFMADHGMTPAMLEEVVLSLEVEDCFDGPEKDRDPRFADHWTVAEFAPRFEGMKLYLKLSIRVDAEQAKCLSVKAYVERLEND